MFTASLATCLVILTAVTAGSKKKLFDDDALNNELDRPSKYLYKLKYNINTKSYSEIPISIFLFNRCLISQYNEKNVLVIFFLLFLIVRKPLKL